MRVLNTHIEKIALNDVEKTPFLLQTKRRENSTYLPEVLVYRATIREPTPRVVSILAYHLVAKNYQFSSRDSKRMLLIFYFKKYRKYINKTNINIFLK